MLWTHRERGKVLRKVLSRLLRRRAKDLMDNDGFVSMEQICDSLPADNERLAWTSADIGMAVATSDDENDYNRFEVRYTEGRVSHVRAAGAPSECGPHCRFAPYTPMAQPPPGIPGGLQPDWHPPAGAHYMRRRCLSAPGIMTGHGAARDSGVVVNLMSARSGQREALEAASSCADVEQCRKAQIRAAECRRKELMSQGMNDSDTMVAVLIEMQTNRWLLGLKQNA